MKFTVVIEKGDRNFSAYVPDLAGCVAAGDTLEETKRLIQEAIEFHIEGMLLDGESIPKPTTIATQVEIDLNKVEKSTARGSRTASG